MKNRKYYPKRSFNGIFVDFEYCYKCIHFKKCVESCWNYLISHICDSFKNKHGIKK